MAEAALKIPESPVRRRGVLRGAESISPTVLARGLAGTPLDHYVIWDGSGYEGRAGSRCSRALALIHEVWTPVPLRELLLRAARIEGDAGFPPDAVRDGVRQHQRASGARYVLVRKTLLGDFVAVTDVPSPAAHRGPLNAGDLVLSRRGTRFGE